MAMHCIVCQTQDIEEVVKENKRYFFCSNCNKIYERSFDPDYGRDISIATEQGLTHLVAGTLIWKEDKFLLLKRRVYTFGYSFPAGHIEYREKPEATLAREVAEETSLRIKKSKLIYEGLLNEHKCRYGADQHYWYFYESQCYPGEVILNSESESYGWYTPDEAAKLDLVPQARYIYNQIFHA